MQDSKGGKHDVTLTDRDWRQFIRLREVARERFAEETLARALKLGLDESVSLATRQARLFALVSERRHEMDALFGDFRRSTSSLRLHIMVHHGLIRKEELEELSLELRRTVSAAN